MTSTRMFDHYETEYLRLTRQAMQDVEMVDQLLPGAEREATAKKATQSIDAAEEIVQSMELEARSLGGDAKQQLIAQAKDYKSGIAGLRTRLRTAHRSSRAEEQARTELLRGTDPTLRLEADNQRDRLMETTERLNRGTDKLRAATQIALETEAVGASIMADLESQKQTIRHARGTLAGASAGLDRSKRLLSGMVRRALQHKVMMYAIIGLLCVMIIFIIWCKRSPRTRTCTVPPPVLSPRCPHTHIAATWHRVPCTARTLAWRELAEAYATRTRTRRCASTCPPCVAVRAQSTGFTARRPQRRCRRATSRMPRRRRRPVPTQVVAMIHSADRALARRRRRRGRVLRRSHRVRRVHDVGARTSITIGRQARARVLRAGVLLVEWARAGVRLPAQTGSRWRHTRIRIYTSPVQVAARSGARAFAAAPCAACGRVLGSSRHTALCSPVGGISDLGRWGWRGTN